MKNTLTRISIASAVVLAGLLATAPAHASESRSVKPEVVQSSHAVMNAVSYDESVAEANGFKIVVHSNGGWESVAVTPEAKRAEAAAGGPIGFTAPVTDGGAVTNRPPVVVRGNCGNSWIQFIRNGNHVTLKTGYNVSHAVLNRMGWAVQVWSTDGNPYFSWADGPSGPGWSAQGGFFNSVGGFGHVLTSSSVLMSNGVICSSGGPTSAI